MVSQERRINRAPVLPTLIRTALIYSVGTKQFPKVEFLNLQFSQQRMCLVLWSWTPGCLRRIPSILFLCHEQIPMKRVSNPRKLQSNLHRYLSRFCLFGPTTIDVSYCAAV